MSSDKETKLKRRNLVAKHSHKFNKGYTHKTKVAYNRKSKALQRDLNDTLGDGPIDG
jgi:hypothetical protein